jgi:hypothetical protein
LCSAIISQFDIIAAIGDPVRIRFWHVCGLPTDAFSTANAILVEAASRHALCIDPHSQVGSWIRNTQKRWKLVRLTSRDTELSQKVMEAADTGALVLVEDFRDTDNLDFLLGIASARAASSSRGPGASAEASIEQPRSAARRATARSSQVASDIARNLLGSAERKQPTLSAAMSDGFRLIITTSLHKPQFRVRALRSALRIGLRSYSGFAWLAPLLRCERAPSARLVSVFVSVVAPILIAVVSRCSRTLLRRRLL